jgi:hypothetical protein
VKPLRKICWFLYIYKLKTKLMPVVKIQNGGCIQGGIEGHIQTDPTVE